MLLLLEDRTSRFTSALAALWSSRGFKQTILSSGEMAKSVVTFRLSDRGEEFHLSTEGQTIQSDEIAGCVCLLETFSPDLWPEFSKQDAEYAAAESHALWLSILKSLGRRVVNAPSPDSLSGAALGPVELCFMAASHGLDVPMTIHVDSSAEVLELLRTGYPMMISDLGKLPRLTTAAGGEGFGQVSPSANSHSVREVLSGELYCVGLAGARTFTATVSPGGGRPSPCDEKDVPMTVRGALTRMVRELELGMCEFTLVKTPRSEWVVLGLGRVPETSWRVHGDSVLEAVLECFPEGKDMGGIKEDV